MVAYENSLGLGAPRASASARSTGAESRVSGPGRAGRAARVALAAALLSSTALVATSAVAQTTNWLGVGGAIGGWSDVLNWDEGVPDAGKDAVIANTSGNPVRIDASGQQANSLNILGDSSLQLTGSGELAVGTTVTLGDGVTGGTLTLDGLPGQRLSVGGGLTVGAGESLLDIVQGKATVTGAVTVNTRGAVSDKGLQIGTGASSDAELVAGSVAVNAGRVAVSGFLNVVGDLNVVGASSVIVNTGAAPAANQGVSVGQHAVFDGAGTTGLNGGAFAVAGNVEVKGGHQLTVSSIDAAAAAEFKAGSGAADTLKIEGAGTVVRVSGSGGRFIAESATTVGAVGATVGSGALVVGDFLAGGGLFEARGGLTVSDFGSVVVQGGGQLVVGLAGASQDLTVSEKGQLTVTANNRTDAAVGVIGDLVLNGPNPGSINVVISKGTVEVAGAVRVNNRTLQIADAVLAVRSNPLTPPGTGILTVTGVGDVQLTNASAELKVAEVVLTDATSALTYTASPAADAAYIITGAGTVKISGSTTTVELKGANTFNGGVTLLDGGTLHVADVATLGGGGIKFDSGVARFAANIASDTGVAFTRTEAGKIITIESLVTDGNTFTIDQALGGVGGVYLETAGGTIALTNDNTFAGSVAILGGGTLRISKLDNLGVGVSDERVVNIGTGATLAVAGTTLADDTNLTLFSGVATRFGIEVLDEAHTFTLNNLLTGSGTLEKKGAGTLVLAQTGINQITGLKISGGTLVATSRGQLGVGTPEVTLNGGFLSAGAVGGVGLADSSTLYIALERAADAGATLLSGFNIQAGKAFTVLNDLTISGTSTGSGTATLVKKGDGTLALRGTDRGYQVNNIIESGTLSVTTAQQLGYVPVGFTTPLPPAPQIPVPTPAVKANVTFAGGALGIGDGTTAATLADDSGLNLIWGDANAARSAIIDVAAASSFTIANQAFGTYNGGSDTVSGALVKKGAGTLVLANVGIDYTGGTVVEAGTLKADGTAFNFRDGRYTVNGGTLEAQTGDLTITRLAGSGKTGSEVAPGQYELNAGTIVIASGELSDVGTQKTSTLTLNETTGEEGFWGKIVGLFTGAAASERAGILNIDAAGKQVVLTGNANQVGQVNVDAGTLRVNDGTLPVSDLLGAPTTVHKGTLTANSVQVNGSAANRAYLAGSGQIVAPVTVSQYGSLLGDRAGTLKITGNLTFDEGATIELGDFASHFNAVPVTGTIENQYFHVAGTVTAAAAGTKINLSSDAIDPGVYRVISSTTAIENGDKFSLGSIGALPADSVALNLTDTNQALDLFATVGSTALRFWNGTPVDGVSTWAAEGSLWTNAEKGSAGKLQQTDDSIALGVFGYTGFPQQDGAVNVSGANTLTQGLQFFTGDWALTGDELALKGGAAGTGYAGVTSIDTGSGEVAIGNRLTGTAALRKTGVGTLTLSGDNSYAGGTIVESGNLVVARDANLGAPTGAVTLKGASATLSLGAGFGATSRDIAVNLPANTSGSVNTGSFIDLGGAPFSATDAVLFGGALTGNGNLVLKNGGAIFTGENAVNFGGTIGITTDAGLAVEKGGHIGAAIVAGTLWGTFGHTLTVDTLLLGSTAQVVLDMPANSNGAVTAFKGAAAYLAGQITDLDLPEGYAVGDNGASFRVFDYVSSEGSITISDSVQNQYASSNFTFGGVVNGYLVLNSKNVPAPQPGVGETVDVDTVTSLQNWSDTTFVTGQTWNNGVATFNGSGQDKPVSVEGLVRVAGLNVNGSNYVFQDAGVSGQPGTFLLQPAVGSSVVDLTVAPHGSATIAIPVAGSDFAKKGDGHLVLSGNSTDFTGTGTVEAGTLYVTSNYSNGSFVVTGGELRVNGVAKQVTVDPNGSLEGLFAGDASGRGYNIGTLLVNGGTLKPGNSPGTLRVGGLTQTAGVIEFERGDKIEVLAGIGGTPDGQAVFSRDANGTQVDLRLTTDTRSYTYGNAYTFVTAENGVTFATGDAVKVTEVGSGRLFSSFAAAAEGRNGVFYLQRNRAFGSEAWTGNQLSVANSLDSLTPADLRSSRGAIYDAIASASNDEALLVRAAFDQLSGEVHASAKGVLIDETRHLREATVNRTRAALSGSAAAAPGQVVQRPADANLGIWGQAYGSWGRTDATSGTAKLDRSTGGFVFGVDAGIADNWRLGIAGGYAKSDIESKSNFSKANVDNYNLAVYGGGQFGGLGLRFGVGHTWHRLDTERQLNVLGLRDTNQAKYDARTIQLYGEAGYELNFGAATVEPFLNLAYVHHQSDNFVERGTGLGSALSSRGQDESTGFSTLGLRVSKNFDLGGAKGLASGTLGWRHAFGDVDPRSVFSAGGSSLFAITGAPIAENALLLGAGLDVEIAAGATLGVSYNGQIGNHTADHGVRGNFSIRF